MTEHEFTLQDRIAKIRSINEQKDLLNNSYVSFSGGKDSTILHHLIDFALPNNNIPRVFMNTGLEFGLTLKFVKELAQSDFRFVIINQTRNIRDTLNQYGYPFKSKEYSLRVEHFNKGSNAKFIRKYMGLYSEYDSKKFICPNKLKYQFEERGKYNYSNQCCYKLKKDLMKKWSKDNNKPINITGMRNDEGGNRERLTCITNNGKSFHPMIVCSTSWENWFIKTYDVKLSALYYEPYNFERTGCVGCPFNIKIQEELDILEHYLPNEYKKAELLWKPVYDEYRRIGYRLRPIEEDKGLFIY